jgi:hypothetical protein
MVYQHLPNPSDHARDHMSAKPRRGRRDNGQEEPASRESADRRDRPGAIGLITGRLMRVFRTHS